MTSFLIVLLLGWLIPAVFANYQNSLSFSGYQYSLYAEGNDEVSFCSATFKCNKWKVGGVLAMPKTERINDVLYEILRTYSSTGTNVWIGGHDIFGEGYWIWIDETPMSWTNWHSGEPNGLTEDHPVDEDCLGISTYADYYGTWYDAICDSARGYLCQFPLNNARVFDDAEFTVYEGKSYFKHAQETCEKHGARLVKIETDEEAEILRTKLTNFVEESRYWIDKKNANDNLCQVAGFHTIEQRECEQISFGTLCENVRPKTEVSNEQPKVTEGEALQVNCTATGYPTPRVSWYKNDKLVSNQSIGGSSSSLLIQNASPEDAGLYLCAATNEINGKPVVSKGVSFVSVLSKDD